MGSAKRRGRELWTKQAKAWKARGLYGTANVFCAVESLGGKHITKVTPNRGAVEFAKMLMAISLRYPRAKTIHLVVDNLNTHTRASVVRHYGEVRGGRLWSRFTVHYTPKHGSWLNQAELEICVMNRRCLGRRRFKSIDELHVTFEGCRMRLPGVELAGGTLIPAEVEVTRPSGDNFFYELEFYERADGIPVGGVTVALSPLPM